MCAIQSASSTSRDQSATSRKATSSTTSRTPPENYAMPSKDSRNRNSILPTVTAVGQFVRLFTTFLTATSMLTSATNWLLQKTNPQSSLMPKIDGHY